MERDTRRAAFERFFGCSPEEFKMAFRHKCNCDKTDSCDHNCSLDAPNGPVANATMRNSLDLLCTLFKDGNLSKDRHFTERDILLSREAEHSKQLGKTPLMEAVNAQDCNSVASQLQKGANVNGHTTGGLSALHIACVLGNLGLVKILINHGANINAHSSSMRTPVMEAASEGLTDIVGYLLSVDPDILNAPTSSSIPASQINPNDPHTDTSPYPFRESPLLIASHRGHVDVVKLILSKSEFMKFEKEDVSASILEAAIDGHVEVVRALLHHSSQKFHIRDVMGPSFNYLIAAGRLDIVKLFIEYGANVCEPDCDGYTPLMDACREGQLEIAKYLVSLGANINYMTRDHGETALTICCAMGNYGIAEFLLQVGALVDLGFTSPLIEACCDNHENIVILLLENGASPNLRCFTGTSPLYHAVECGNFSIVKTLIEYGCDIDLVMENGKTALMRAVENSFVNITDYLVTHGADVNYKSASTDNTPLACACFSGNVLMAKLLLSLDADAYISFNDSSNLLIESARCGEAEIVSLLLRPFSFTKTELKEFQMHPNNNPKEKYPRHVCKSRDNNCIKCNQVSFFQGLLNGGFEKFQKHNTKFSELFKNDLSFNADGNLNFTALLDRIAKEFPPDHDMPNFSSSASIKNQNTRSVSEQKLDHICDARFQLLADRMDGFFKNCSKALIDVNQQTSINKETALMIACLQGHLNVVTVLLDCNADVYHIDKKGMYPLAAAIGGSHTNIVAELIRRKVDVNFKNERARETPLTMSALHGRTDIIELLLNNGANIEMRNMDDYTPLGVAANSGQAAAVKVLINRKAEINSKIGYTPLMLSALNGHISCAKLLLEHGADINNQQDNNGNTAVSLAVYYGKSDMVQFLLSRGCIIDTKSKHGLTPFLEAAHTNNTDIATLLILYKSDVLNVVNTVTKDNALTLAAEKGNFEFIKLLLNYKMSPDHRNKKGQTASYLSASGGYLKCLILLHEYKANLELCDANNLSPLFAAYRNSHIETVQWLSSRVNQLPSLSICMKILTKCSKDEHDKCAQMYRILEETTNKRAKIAEQNAEQLVLEVEKKKNKKKKRRTPKKPTKADSDDESKSVVSIKEDVKCMNEIKVASIDIQELEPMGIIDKGNDKVKQQLNGASKKNVSDSISPMIPSSIEDNVEDDGWVESSKTEKKKLKPKSFVKSQNCVIHITKHCVSKTIGRGGITISAIKNKTSTHIDIDTRTNPTHEMYPVTITGEEANVKEAIRILREIESNSVTIMDELSASIKELTINGPFKGTNLANIFEPSPQKAKMTIASNPVVNISPVIAKSTVETKTRSLLKTVEEQIIKKVPEVARKVVNVSPAKSTEELSEPCKPNNSDSTEPLVNMKNLPICSYEAQGFIVGNDTKSLNNRLNRHILHPELIKSGSTFVSKVGDAVPCKGRKIFQRKNFYLKSIPQNELLDSAHALLEKSDIELKYLKFKGKVETMSDFEKYANILLPLVTPMAGTSDNPKFSGNKMCIAGYDGSNWHPNSPLRPDRPKLYMYDELLNGSNPKDTSKHHIYVEPEKPFDINTLGLKNNDPHVNKFGYHVCTIDALLQKCRNPDLAAVITKLGLNFDELYSLYDRDLLNIGFPEKLLKHLRIFLENYIRIEPVARNYLYVRL